MSMWVACRLLALLVVGVFWSASAFASTFYKYSHWNSGNGFFDDAFPQCLNLTSVDDLPPNCVESAYGPYWAGGTTSRYRDFVSSAGAWNSTTNGRTVPYTYEYTSYSDSAWVHPDPGSSQSYIYYDKLVCASGTVDWASFTCAAECVSPQIIVNGVCVDPPQCPPDPATAPDLDMVWEYDQCRWEYLTCTSEASGRTVAASALPSGMGVGDRACIGGCIWILREVVEAEGWLNQTSFECTSGMPEDLGNEVTPPLAPWSDNNCITGTSGASHCYISGGAQNCGYFNGEWVCVDPIADNSCVSTEAGGVFCVGSGVPPTPSPPGAADLSGEVSNVAASVGTPGGGSTSFGFWSATTINTAGGVPAPGEPGSEGIGLINPFTGETDTPLEGNPMADENLPDNPVPEDFTIEIEEPSATWDSGIPETGTCPAPVVVEFSFADMPISFAFLCDVLLFIRPMVIALGGLFAAWIFVKGAS